MRFFTGATLLIGPLVAHRAASEDSAPPKEPPLVEKVRDGLNSYIVQLKDAPVIEHSETKPGHNRKLDVTSDSVQEYSAYLESQQDETAATIGGQKMYSYKYSFNGFSATMTAAEAQALASQSNVVKIWEDETRELTDGTPEFLGLTGPGEAWELGFTGEDVVVGIIDSGIHAEHPSFADTPTPLNGNTGNMVPFDGIPSGFSGTGCDFGNQEWNPKDTPFACNNKVISAKCFALAYSDVVNASLPCGGDGARLAPDEFLSARDASDHGSHVASIAAGNYGVEAVVGDSNLTLSGVAPRARLAIYKVCWTDILGNRGSCPTSNVLAAIDQAVADGVDVINLSLGSGATDFDQPDDLALLLAVNAGIHVAAAAGNSGPGSGTVGSPGGLPWVTGVGAATDEVVPGAKLSIYAPASVFGVYEGVEANSTVQLADIGGIITGDIVPAEPLDACTAIQNNLMDKIALVIRGKCTFTQKFNNVTAAGAKFIVVFNDGNGADRQDPMRMLALNTTIPGIQISYTNGKLLEEASATETVTGSAMSAPLDNAIATFSSRGPNGGALDIIKPDIVAPGVAILAAGSPFTAGGLPDDEEIFEQFQGTSMSSPHVAGIFALLKQAHPDWSPAIAKSALMTTARQDLAKALAGKAADPFDMGSGHVVPQNAFDPGLAFDVSVPEYEAFICGVNKAIPQSRCNALSALGLSFGASQLNHPSIGVSQLAGTQTITRTVTSVANTTGEETFTVSLEAPPGFAVSVNPNTIKLLPGANATFNVTLTANDNVSFDEWSFGSMTWSNGGGNLRRNSTYSVRSPIAVKASYFSFPSSVFGAGSSVASGPKGTLTFDIGFSFAGSYTASVYGLEKPSTQQASVDEDPLARYRFPDGLGVKRFIFKFARGSILARFALLDEFTDGDDDLDMYVWACPEGRDTINSDVCAFSGASTNSTSTEFLDVPYPQEAFGRYGTYYIVDIHGYRTEARETTIFTLFHWDLGTNDDYQNMVVNAPTSAVPGLAPVTVSWPGINKLDSGETYLGAITHTGPAGVGVLGLTTIEIKS